MKMEGILRAAGVEGENCSCAAKIIETMKRTTGCKTFAIVNVAESDDLLIKLFEPNNPISARTSLSVIAREDYAVRDATILYPRSGLSAPLEIHVRMMKEGRRGIERYAPTRIEKIYLEERLKLVAGSGVRMPRRLAIALRVIAAEIITYCKPELKLLLDYSSGESRCVVTFVGVRECSLSFLEHIFDRCGRYLVDVGLRSVGVERQLIVTLDTEAELMTFPRRKDEPTGFEPNKRARE